MAGWCRKKNLTAQIGLMWAYTSSSIVHWQGDLQMLLERAEEGKRIEMKIYVALRRHRMRMRLLMVW